MSEELSKQAMTKGEYDQFVADNNRTPTQDPMYNHAEGNPARRLSTSPHISMGSIDMSAKALADEKLTTRQKDLIDEDETRAQE